MAKQATENERLAWALSRAAHWLIALADDGPDLRVNAHRKAVHEAQELADDPSPEEAADLLICLVGTCLRHGWTVGDLADAVTAKVTVNAARHWAQQPDGTWQHVAVIPTGSSSIQEPPVTDAATETEQRIGRGLGQIAAAVEHAAVQHNDGVLGNHAAELQGMAEGLLSPGPGGDSDG